VVDLGVFIYSWQPLKVVPRVSDAIAGLTEAEYGGESAAMCR
jgi:hypothetical protein